MFGDLDWPLNVSCRFVSIRWASCIYLCLINLQIAATQPNCMKVLPLAKKENTHRVKLLLYFTYFKIYWFIWVIVYLLFGWQNVSIMVPETSIWIINNNNRGDTICPRPTHCTHTVAHLQSIAYTLYTCGTQRTLHHEYSWSTTSSSLWAVA